MTHEERVRHEQERVSFNEKWLEEAEKRKIAEAIQRSKELNPDLWERARRHREAKTGAQTNGHEPEPFVASVALVASRTNFSQAQQTLQPEALHGIAGDVVRAIDPVTESDPAAVLLSFLVGIGCVIGRTPHIYRDGARHSVNEFGCLVGYSSKGRKGTATRRTDEVLKCIDSSNSTKWNDMREEYHPEQLTEYERLHLSGLGSGEGLIEALSDDDDKDKRRLVFEEEFSKPLKVMRREGSILSEVIRAAWDGGVLSNRTKGKHLIARETHISILGHITEAELRMEMTSASLFNGFANRFLWFVVSRSKSLPFGGGEINSSAIVKRLQETLQYARKTFRLEFDEQTKAIWAGGVYDLLIDRPAGLLGAVTSRAEAHVTRLALLYALLDLQEKVEFVAHSLPIIRAEHLLAALAVWDFSEKSCAYLFGQSTGDDRADTIDEKLRDVYPDGLIRTQIRDMFNRHASKREIDHALGVLLNQDRAEFKMVETGGRNAELWLAKSRATSDQSDRSDKSPLQLARELAR